MLAVHLQQQLQVPRALAARSLPDTTNLEARTVGPPKKNPKALPNSYLKDFEPRDHVM